MRKWLRIAAAAGLILALGVGLIFAPEEPVRRAAPTTAADLGLLLEEEGAVIVLGVSEHSPAALAGFEPGDRIISTDGARVGSVDALELLLQAAEDLPLMVVRDQREQVVVLPVQ